MGFGPQKEVMTDMFDASDRAAERYVALGDSYTIGEGAEENESWPMLLTKHLQEQGVAIQLVANPSVTGWTTKEVIERELPILETSRPTFVTLLIGVNDWVQGVSPMEFGERLAEIVDRIQAVLPHQGKVILITIPDFLSRLMVGNMATDETSRRESRASTTLSKRKQPADRFVWSIFILSHKN